MHPLESWADLRRKHLHQTRTTCVACQWQGPCPTRCSNLFCKSTLYDELQIVAKDENAAHRNRRMEDTSYASVSGQPKVSINTWASLKDAFRCVRALLFGSSRLLACSARSRIDVGVVLIPDRSQVLDYPRRVPGSIVIAKSTVQTRQVRRAF